VGHYLTYILLGGLVLQYLTTYFAAFFMDLLLCNVLNLEESINPFRRLGHFLSTHFVLLAYNFVEFGAIWEIGFRGKAACGHRPSKKENLTVSEA